MNGIYEVIIKFYEKMEHYYEEHPKEFFVFGKRSIVEKDLASDSYKIIHLNENVFDMYYQHLTNFYDVSVIINSLIDSVYVFDNPYHKKLEEYYNSEKNRIYSVLYKSIYVNYIMSKFIVRVRSHYLKDFFEYSDIREELLAFRNIISKIYYKYPKINIKNDLASSHVLSIFENKKDAFVNELLEIRDSSFIKKLILKQNEFYVNELTRLEEEIMINGNKLNVSNEVFYMYMEFISELKNNSLSVVNSLKEEFGKTK